MITIAMKPADTDEPDPQDLCNYGSIGVLNTRPDSIQCHICGEWWTSLTAHAQQTHDLSADEYRAAFGLMKKTKLVAPVLREAQSLRAAEHVGDFWDRVTHVTHATPVLLFPNSNLTTLNDNSRAPVTLRDGFRFRRRCLVGVRYGLVHG